MSGQTINSGLDACYHTSSCLVFVHKLVWQGCGRTLLTEPYLKHIIDAHTLGVFKWAVAVFKSFYSSKGQGYTMAELVSLASFFPG